MECMNVISLKSTSFAAKATQGLSFYHSLNPVPLKSAFYLQPHVPNYSSIKQLSFPNVKSQQFELKDGSATLSETTLSEGPFEFRLQNEGNTPRNILEEIVWHKDMEVSQMKEKKPLSVLKELLDNAPPVRDFIRALKEANSRTGCPGLIAEVKKASPSRGVLREDFDPVHIAKAYEKGGAACLSVLTDEKFFQGSFGNLEAIRNSGVQCPLLCKEFVIDAWQVFYARVKGADAILLIAAVLPDLDIKYMIKICKLLGLTALVEVHDEREMDRVLEIDGIELVGINNRDLGTFNVDIASTKKLLEGERGQRIREKGITVVGESGLFTPDDIAYVQEAGVKAVLVGESIVKQNDPSVGITQLFGKDISL